MTPADQDQRAWGLWGGATPHLWEKKPGLEIKSSVDFFLEELRLPLMSTCQGDVTLTTANFTPIDYTNVPVGCPSVPSMCAATSLVTFTNAMQNSPSNNAISLCPGSAPFFGLTVVANLTYKITASVMLNLVGCSSPETASIFVVFLPTSAGPCTQTSGIAARCVSNSISMISLKNGANPVTIDGILDTAPSDGTYQLILCIGSGTCVSISPSASLRVQCAMVCLHGASLVHMATGQLKLKRMDQVQIGDQVTCLDAHNTSHTATVKKIHQCWLQPNWKSTPHDTVVLEPDSLGPGEPSHRLIIDPGHPICRQQEYTQRGKDALKPSAMFVLQNVQETDMNNNNNNEHPKMFLTKWTDEKVQNIENGGPSVRYDLELEHPDTTFVANGLVIQSRKSFSDPGYDHRFWHFR